MAVEKDLALDFARVAEAGALAAARWMGQGNNDRADEAAVEAMRRSLDEMDVDGTVVIGEGERDEAPMLYIGERLGTGTGPRVDVAVDPVEGTNLVARGQANALSVIAASSPGGLLHAPDTYMEKLIVGPAAAGKVSLEYPVQANLQIIADSLDRHVDDLTIVILDRPRHGELIEEVRRAGARIKLISDGDLSAAISVAVTGTGDDAVFGIGGAPEGVLSAVALRCLGGQMLARIRPRNDAEAERARQMGIDLDREYRTEDLASGDELIFAATGITEGDLFQGVHFFGGGARTHSLVMTFQTGRVSVLDTIHILERRAVTAVRL
jgi:fructose-1,6-bisphosphatase II